MIYTKLLALPLLPAILMPIAGSDRDWWRSDAGKVTEHRDRDGVTCTFVLQNDQGRFQFMWSNKLPPRAIVQRPNWSLPSDRMWTVSLRIGSTWLGNGDGTPNIPALTGPHRLMFLLGQPISDLLNDAQDLALQTPDRVFEISVPHRKMRPLVRALRRCTTLIGLVRERG
jgi:hypothetical protein